MINFPKVTKGSARGVSGRQRVKKIIGSFALAAGIAGAAVAGGSGAAVSQDTSGVTGVAQGALVFMPSNANGELRAYHQSHQSHQSHRSHNSHQSHQSHYSHYSGG